MAIIELKNVTYFYPHASEPALRSVNLRVEKGEYVLLTGPSGCGKSTLCRVLNGLIPHFYGGQFEGQATVCGLDVLKTPIHVLATKVGMVFQNPENQLYMSTVEREIAFGLENLALPPSEISIRVERVIEELGLAELRSRAPYELSGGQQQKVAIASVLALEPEVLVLDEPTANLDPLSANEVLSLLNQLREKKGLTIILVEHRLEIALQYASRLIIMDRGRIVEDGDPRRILLSPSASIIGIPKVVETYIKLKQQGLHLNRVPLTPEELAASLATQVRSYEGSRRG